MKRTGKSILLAVAVITTMMFTGCNNKNNEENIPGASEATENNANTAEPAGNGNVEDAVIQDGEKYAVVTIKDFGEITLKLYPEYAPVAVENFIATAESGFYDGKKMHRVMKDFMMQGGSANGDGLSDPNEKTFGAEPNPKMRHFYGSLCMAMDNLGRIGTQFYIVNSKDTDTFQSMLDNYSSLETQTEFYKSQYDEAVALFQKGQLEQDIVDIYENQYNSSLAMLEEIKNTSDDVIEKYAKVGGSSFLDGTYTVFGQTVDGFDVIDRVAEVELVMGSDTTPSVPKEDIFIESVIIKTK